ncbi:MAG: hypothetical protein AB7O96_10805 [Pseudobdellovibrionaceae bacterium]
MKLDSILRRISTFKSPINSHYVTPKGLCPTPCRFTEKEKLVCNSLRPKGYTIVLDAKSQSNVEGKAIAYWTSIDHPNGDGYQGMIFGYKEDVMLNLKPRANDNVQLTGTIFMDDEEQNLEYEKSPGKWIKLKVTCNLHR